MPYITPEQRGQIASGARLHNSGELTYALTKLLVAYLDTNGESYCTYNEMVGALECAKLELYRRKVADYEDIKIKQNGDVYK